MKEKEVMRRYANGEKDFSGVSLKGQSFKEQNLSGADFSNADIQGADFTNAILKDAKFTQAKAGLQQYRAIFGLIVSLFFSSLSGFTAAVAGAFVAAFFDPINIHKVTNLQGVILLIVFVVFLTIIIRDGIRSALTLALGLAFAYGLAFVLAFSLAFPLAGPSAFALALVVAFAFGATFSVALAVAWALYERLGFFVGLAGAVVGAVVGSLVGSFSKTFSETFARALAFNLALSGALTFTFLAGYISWRAIAEDWRFSLMRNIAVNFAAKGGTSFRGATLTNANFTQATLKGTDFREAILARTCWFQVKKLNLARVGTTYLDKLQVRQLLTTGDGQDENFDHRDLRGVNLQGAKLADASFIGTNLSEAYLQEADLSRVKLVQTQLDRTDLTGATLTGATIEDWGITSHTNLHGVRCEYVFMRVPTTEDPNPRRKPDNWAETFKDGDFGDFIKPIFDTLDLYHNQDVDPRAIAISFKQLAENHPEAELEIVSMERRGQENFLLRAKTDLDADRSALSAEYFEYYNSLKALPKDNLIFLLAQKDGQIQSLEIAFITVTKGLEAVAETPKYNLNNAQFGGGFAAEGGIQTGGTFNDFSSNQNLSEAATQIQQRLTQLQTQGYSQQDAQQQVAEELATQAKNDPTVLGKLVKWGQSLGNAAAKTTVTEATTAVVKLALILSGIPLS